MGFSYDRHSAAKLPPTLVSALEAHFEHNYAITGKNLVALRELLADRSSKYVREPRCASVYRGLTVTPRWCAKNRIDPSAKGPQRVRFRIGATNKAVSWSASRKVAEGYFELSGDDSRHVLLRASVAGNPGVFAAGPNGLYEVAGARQVIDKEMLALWPVEVFEAEVIASVGWIAN